MMNLGRAVLWAALMSLAASVSAQTVAPRAPTSLLVDGQGGNTGPCSAPANTPGGSDGFGGCFPGPGNTGVPSGITLTTYTGPCNITVANTVIDSKTINCDISISANNVTIKNSRVNGMVQNDEGSANSFTIVDSVVDANARQPSGPSGYRNIKAICCEYFTITRSEITDATGIIYCGRNGVIQDSYVHGIDLRDPNSLAHASALRVEHNCTVTHNTLHCDYTGPFNNSDIGCSADLTQYPQMGPNHDNVMTNNLFVANQYSAYCSYGGHSASTYTNDPMNDVNVKFINNVFQRGSNKLCGSYGPVGDWQGGHTGQEWTNNIFDDGVQIDPTRY